MSRNAMVWLVLIYFAGLMVAAHYWEKLRR